MNRHVEALAEEFLGRGHDVRVLAPVDPPGRFSRVLHRAQAERRELPEYLTPLGRTMGFGANGSVSNLAPFPAGGVVAPRRLVRSGEFDVLHVHEPVVPLVGWNATLGARDPIVGTFHTYSTKPMPNYIANALGARRVFNRLSARIAVSEAAAWTGRRWFGGEYTIIPNGVDVDAAPASAEVSGRRARDPLRRPARGAQGTADSAHRLQRPGRARPLPADRDRRRPGGRPPLRRRPRAAALHGHPRAGLARGPLGGPTSCRPALRPLALGRELRHGPDRGLRGGDPGDRLGDRRLQRRRQRRRRRPPGSSRRPAATRRGAAAGALRAGATAGDGGGGASQRAAVRLATGGRPGDRRLRARDRGSEAGPRLRAVRPLGRPPTRRRWAQAARRAPALARPRARPGQQAGQGRGPPLGPRGRRNHGSRPHPARRRKDRRRQGRREHRPLQLDLGAHRLRPDGKLTLLPRRLLVLDCPRGAAQSPDTPPRRHLGDDDRGADVGDAAGSSR